ncbi:MAG: GNAT family N-acetyltransferase [Burkholderiaceae bacterium]
MELQFRLAGAADVTAIVVLLADDPLGATREQAVSPLPDAYVRAFADIEADPNNELWLAVRGQSVVGVAQLTVIPTLTRGGCRRGLIEGVRVASSERGSGVGSRLIEMIAVRARALGCGMLQLTSDKRRTDAGRFYERLGFVPSHVGFKRDLD